MTKELLLKRLQYRSGHRGCKETDLILGEFSQARLAQLDDRQLAVYDRLLDEDDADIWKWLTDKAAPAPEYGELISMLKGYRLT